MNELLREQGQSINHELYPDPSVVDALIGTISEPIQTISHKPGSEGQVVTVRLAKEGPGMFGLTDWKGNKEWSGIFNHCLLTARYSLHFAQMMTQSGYDVNPQRILDGMIVSHAGRRQWDEAAWYPEVIEDAQVKRSISNETLGMQLIQGKVPKDAFELVVALGHNVAGFSVDPEIYNSWDFKLTIYVDHRTTQKYEPLNIRMGDFLLGNFFKRDKVTPPVKEQVYTAIGNIIGRQKSYRLGKEGAESLSLDEADRIAEELGAHPKSERLTRRELMRLILQDATTEAALIQAGIDPDAINDEIVPMPKWEDELRRQYVEAAKNSIGGDDVQSEFSQNTWWEQYAGSISHSSSP